MINSITVDEHSRLTDDQRRRVRSLLAKHIRAFAMNPKDPAHTHLMEVELPLEEALPDAQLEQRLRRKRPQAFNTYHLKVPWMRQLFEQRCWQF